MKILNVIQGTHIGGMEQSSLLLMRELISLGHDISLLSLTKMGLLKKDLEESNIKSRGFPYKGPVRSFRPFELQKLHIFREGGCYNANWP